MLREKFIIDDALLFNLLLSASRTFEFGQLGLRFVRLLQLELRQQQLVMGML